MTIRTDSEATFDAYQTLSAARDIVVKAARDVDQAPCAETFQVLRAALQAEADAHAAFTTCAGRL